MKISSAGKLIFFTICVALAFSFFIFAEDEKPVMVSSGTAVGKIIAIDAEDFMISVRLESTKPAIVKIGVDKKTSILKGGMPIRFSEMKIYDFATVNYDIYVDDRNTRRDIAKNINIELKEGEPFPRPLVQHGEDVVSEGVLMGEIGAISTEKNTISIKVPKKLGERRQVYLTIAIKDTTNISKGPFPAELSDLRVGNLANVQYTVDREGKSTATFITEEIKDQQ